MLLRLTLSARYRVNLCWVCVFAAYEGMRKKLDLLHSNLLHRQSVAKINFLSSMHVYFVRIFGIRNREC